MGHSSLADKFPGPSPLTLGSGARPRDSALPRPGRSSPPSASLRRIRREWEWEWGSGGSGEWDLWVAGGGSGGGLGEVLVGVLVGVPAQ
ncbi:hypothetical protein GCM10010361_39660 [Streptomyces olivaceiscleroticus]|uniref:Uncharacterized protein n=1 Tax=Streptomyces olivaceiscleroticus TaxID=68245 RepID=A0ABP3K596_9ACTN